MSDTDYRFTVRPLTGEEGGGYLVEFSDLPGCMSDGETIGEAVAKGEDAKRRWIAAMKEAGRPVPPPSLEPVEDYSGKWQLRAPKSLHRRLVARAKREGVSLNTLAVTLLAEGLGERSRMRETRTSGLSHMVTDISQLMHAKRIPVQMADVRLHVSAVLQAFLDAPWEGYTPGTAARGEIALTQDGNDLLLASRPAARNRD
jgi:antitoxin HicB